MLTFKFVSYSFKTFQKLKQQELVLPVSQTEFLQNHVCIIASLSKITDTALTILASDLPLLNHGNVWDVDKSRPLKVY